MFNIYYTTETRHGVLFILKLTKAIKVSKILYIFAVDLDGYDKTLNTNSYMVLHEI